MGKPHVGEVDYLRVLGLISIVIIHAWGFFLLMPVASPYSRIFQELGVNLLRFGRQIFMFITGLVLFYSYSGRQLNTARFFNRRLRNLIIPYVIWTAIYLIVKIWSGMISWPGASGFVTLWLQNLLNGNGYSHLYFIIVTIQFYLVFPLILAFRPHRPHRWAWLILGGGLLFYGFYYYLLELQGDKVSALVTGTTWDGLVRWVMFYKDRLLFSYFPYYLLGALVGLYLDQWRQWLKQHTVLAICGLFVFGGLAVGEYFHFYHYLGQGWGLTISVFKPSLYLYSLAVIACFFRLAFYLERRGYLRWLVTPLAANSFGIYLIHPAVLYIFHSVLWKYQHLPGYVLVVLDPAAAVAASWGLCALIGSNRYTRLIIGEAGSLRQFLSRKQASPPQNAVATQSRLPGWKTST